MLAVSSNVLVPIMTLVLGFASALVTEDLRDRRQTRREREARALERRAIEEAHRREAEARSHEFQRQTLIDLQEALNNLMQVYGEIYRLGVETSSGGVPWNQVPLPPQLAERSRDTERRTMILSSRVTDDEIRRLVSEVKKRGNVLRLSALWDQAENAFLDATPLAADALERMGELIRSFLA